MNGHRFIFVGGLHRSGTSLIAKAIAAHPSVSGLSNTGAPEDEGQHVQNVYPSARRHGGPGRFAFDPAAHLTEASPLANAANAKRLFAAWARYWDLQQTVLMEKSPPNVIRTRFLQAMFPDSIFVIVMRHPIPVVLATMRKGWCNDALESQLEHWLHCHQLFRQDQTYLCKTFVIRYEAFVQAPSTTLCTFWESLGLSEAPISTPIESDVNDRYFQQWREIHQGSDGQNVCATLEERFDARLAEFGYRLAEARESTQT